MMEYKGYTARVEFDQEARILFGEVEGLRDVVTFEAGDVKSLEREFHASVDDYLAMCAERGEEPEKPYSGKFVVRVDPVLHREVAMAAVRSGKSLNAFASEALKRWLEQARQTQLPPRVPAPNVSEAGGPLKVFAPTAPLVEVVAAGEPSLGLWPTAQQDTPGSRTPNTPGASRTPQQKQFKVA
jgi:predicted HicB family RNase H-like nuclease